MGEKLSLNNICTGQTARVVRINAGESMKRRLNDIGLSEGCCISCVGKSPMGDPSAFLIRGAVVALRHSECRDIAVSLMEAGM